MAENRRVLTLVDRKELCVSGVKEVVSFDENGALMITESGELEVCGSNVHVANLNTAGGEVQITGKIDSMIYSDVTGEKRKGLFGRLFG